MPRYCPTCRERLDKSSYCRRCRRFFPQQPSEDGPFGFRKLTASQKREIVIGLIVAVICWILLAVELCETVIALVESRPFPDSLAKHFGKIVGYSSYVLPPDDLMEFLGKLIGWSFYVLVIIFSTKLPRSILFPKKWNPNKPVSRYVTKGPDGEWRCPYCHMENLGADRCEKCGLPPIFQANEETYPNEQKNKNVILAFILTIFTVFLLIVFICALTVDDAERSASSSMPTVPQPTLIASVQPRENTAEGDLYVV